MRWRPCCYCGRRCPRTICAECEREMERTAEMIESIPERQRAVGDLFSSEYPPQKGGPSEGKREEH